jgi:hypothetical protein
VEPAGRAGRDRLGREGVALACRQTQEIAREQEAHDLPAAVRQQLVHPHGPGGDVEQLGRRVALAGQDLAGNEVPS